MGARTLEVQHPACRVIGLRSICMQRDISSGHVPRTGCRVFLQNSGVQPKVTVGARSSLLGEPGFAKEYRTVQPLHRCQEHSGRA
jgi:hypothetical protein